MNKKVFSTEVLVIAAVEIAFGLFEGLVIPNIIGQKFDKNWRFKMPPVNVVIKITAVLFVTGMLSGLISDNVIQYFDNKVPAPAANT